MLSEDRPYTLDRLVRLVIGGLVVLALIWLVKHLSDVLLPFAAALALAYFINPLVNLVQRGVPNRAVAVGMTLVALLVAVVGVFWVVLPALTSEFTRMGVILKDLVSNTELAAKAANRLPPDLWQWLRDTLQRPEVQDIFSGGGMGKLAEQVSSRLLPGVWGVISGAANAVLALVGLLVVFLYLVFLLADFGKIRDGWTEYLPEKYRHQAAGFAEDFTLVMNRYFRSQALIALLVGVMAAVGFSLIGLPLGIMLGLLVGALNMAPYLSLAAMPPALFLASVQALESGNSIWVAMGLVLLVMGVVQVIQDTILVPRIQGESMGLSPWMILLALSVWGKLLGFLGLIVALPMTCLVLAYYRRYLSGEVRERVR